jgi:hypothetical protein
MPTIIDNKLWRGMTRMLLWMVGGYVLAAVAFYSYIVATAQDEPQESIATVIEITEWQKAREREEGFRKAA